MGPRYEMKRRVVLPSRSAPAPPLCGAAQVPKACISDPLSQHPALPPDSWGQNGFIWE